MILFALLGSFSVVQTAIALAVVALVSSGIAWWLQQIKIRALYTHLDQQRAESQTALDALNVESAQAALQAQQKLDEVQVERMAVEERFLLHRDAAQRRESDSLARIAALETDLATNRELAGQLAPAQARIRDLETTLTAERGRVSALEQTLSVTNTRVQDLTRQLQESQTHFTAQLERSRAREAELMRQLADREQTLASDQARLGTVDDEIARLKDTLTSYQSTAETRIAGLQRQLAAAEAKSAMVQKEFMSAVGVLPEGPSAATNASNDRRANELEAKINQVEAESRKKAREDGYKIAELEYRLSEATEANARLQVLEARAAEVDALLNEVKSLTADREKLVQDLETMKIGKAKSVEPVPEVLEQSFLPMDADKVTE